MMPCMKRGSRWIDRWGGLVVLLAVGPAAACSNKLGGDLKVNGQPFAAASCRSGAVFGVSGVEVTGKGGQRLRVVQLPTGEAQVVLFAPGAQVGSDLGVCGSIQVTTQSSTVNNVRNVEGKAQLQCTADGVTVAGTLTFENCH